MILIKQKQNNPLTLSPTLAALLEDALGKRKVVELLELGPEVVSLLMLVEDVDRCLVELIPSRD